MMDAFSRKVFGSGAARLLKTASPARRQHSRMLALLAVGMTLAILFPFLWIALCPEASISPAIVWPWAEPIS